jgi:hypothetical protein
MGGGGNDVVKSTNTYEIQILSAGYQKPAKTGKRYLAPHIPDIAAHNSYLVPCPLNTKSSIWLVLPDSIDKTQSF